MLVSNNFITIFENLTKEQKSVFYSYRKLYKTLKQSDYFNQEMHHNYEVFNNSLKLITKESIKDVKTIDIIKVTALLHDIGRYTKKFNLIKHTDINSEQLRSYIHPSLYKYRDLITKGVQRHSLSSKEKPENLIEKIIFDADNLTLFSKFGYARWFFKAESWGHTKDLILAQNQLEKLFTMATKNELFYLKSSSVIFRKSFYSRHIYK